MASHTNRKVVATPNSVSANMPQFITHVPWYVNNDPSQNAQPSLKHHTLNIEKQDLNTWYQRGLKGPQATTYRKGACQNCGAMGHSKKECAERPRKTGAKFTSRDIAPDDMSKQLFLDWQSKRDRWNGYDLAKQKQIIQEFEMYEEMKKKQMEIIEEKDVDEEYRETLDPDKAASLASKFDKISRKYYGLSGIRNREDRAKYLMNLELNSAHFDPKSRSMPENPNYLLPQEKQVYKGDKAALRGPEKNDLIEQERFTLEQIKYHNAEFNSMALPSLTEHVFKTVKKKYEMETMGRTGELIKKYGGEDFLNNKPTDQIVATEAYVEYNTEGKIKKAVQQFGRAKSKYPEDVFINNHASVWGSWWNEYLGWGYSCCHSTTKMSMCLEAKGKEIALQKEYKVKKDRLKLQQELMAKQKEKEEKQKAEEESNGKAQRREEDAAENAVEDRREEKKESEGLKKEEEAAQA